MQQLTELLQQNAYPGRGIVLGKGPNGEGVILYFIMGRSANSRNRVFTERDGGIITEAADPAKMEDPSLIIYAPVRKHQNHTVVTNGDQTDTIVEYLEKRQRFEDALEQRTFEPDAPNFTPRISGILEQKENGFSYKLSILKSNGGNPDSVQRFYYHYAQPTAGQAHFIHTYQSDGDPLPSFYGEPVLIEIPADIEAFGQTVWESLNPDNKVSLFVRVIDKGGREKTWIYNRFDKTGAGQ